MDDSLKCSAKKSRRLEQFLRGEVVRMISALQRTLGFLKDFFSTNKNAFYTH